MKNALQDLALAFAQASVGPSDRSSASCAAVGSCIEAALAQGKVRYPNVEIAGVDFASYLGKHLSVEQMCSGYVETLVVEELFLCCACLTGNDSAVSEFDRRFRKLASIVKRYTSEVDDVLQSVGEKLLVGVRGGPPRLLDYGGQGDLDAWLRVVATRAAIDAARKRGHVLVDDEELWRVPATMAALDSALHKKRAAALIKAAFQDALKARTPKERLLLRQHLIDDLSIDEMAPMHGVHRVTIARRLTKIRSAVWAAAKTQLSLDLTLTPSQVEGILGDVRSQLDLSIERVLS